MPFCPVCHAEFREGFTRCNSCDVELVERLQDEIDLSEENVRQMLDGKELVAVTRGTLDVVKETRELLSKNRIASIIVEDEEAKLPPGMPPRVLLVVSKDALEDAGRVLGESFREMIEEEGVAPGGGDLTYEKCPACGTEVPEDTEECPECGLFIAKV